MEMSNETPCIDILNKQKCLFSKIRDRKVEQVLTNGKGEAIRKIPV
jgi:hypothetical protein